MSIQLFSRPFSECFAPFPGLFETVTLAIGLDDMNTVCQAIQQGSCQPFVAHNLHPVLKWQICRYNQACLLVALAEEAKQIFSANPIQRDVTKLIYDNKVATLNVLFQLQDSSFLPSLDVSVHQL